MLIQHSASPHAVSPSRPHPYVQYCTATVLLLVTVLYSTQVQLKHIELLHFILSQAGSDVYARIGFSMIAVSQPLGNQAPGFSSTALAIIVVVVIAIIVIAIVVVVIAIFW